MHPISYAMHILPDFCEIKGWNFFCCGTNKWFCIRLKIRHKELFLFHCSSCVSVQRGLLKWYYLSRNAVTYVSYNINCNGTHSRCSTCPQTIWHIKYNMKYFEVFQGEIFIWKVVICIPYNVKFNVFYSIRNFFWIYFEE